MRLIANRPILYRSSQYRKGDALPADNATMVSAWLDSESAVWIDEADGGSDGKADKVPEQDAAPQKKAAAKKPAAKKGMKK